MTRVTNYHMEPMRTYAKNHQIRLSLQLKHDVDERAKNKLSYS